MKKKMIATVIAGLALVAGAAQAQTQTQTTPVIGQPQRVETTVHESWTVTCQDTADKKNNCTAIIRVGDNQSGNILLVLAVGKDVSSGKPTAIMQTPTGIQLEPGVVLKVGRSSDRKLNYVSCTPRQCDATAPFDNSFLKDINAATEATAVITLIDGRTAEFKFPLNGSTSALKLVAAS